MAVSLLIALSRSVALAELVRGGRDVHNGTSTDHDADPFCHCEFHPSTKSRSETTATLWHGNAALPFFWRRLLRASTNPKPSGHRQHCFDAPLSQKAKANVQFSNAVTGFLTAEVG
jgi:hypothetical protein